MSDEIVQLEPAVAVLFFVVGLVAILAGMWLAASEAAISRITVAYAEDLVEEGRRGAPALLEVVSERKQLGSTLASARVLFQVLGIVTLTWVLSVELLELDWVWWGVFLATIGVVGAVQLVAVGISRRLLSGSRYVGVALLGSRLTLALMRRRPRRRGEQRAAEERVLTSSEARLRVADELRELVDQVAEDGSPSLEDEDRRILRSVFELGQTRVGEVMVPRSEMVTVRGDEDGRAALESFVQSGFSRLPVVGKSLDDVQGVLYMKDLVRRSLKGEDALRAPVAGMARAAAFVPEMKLADDELRVMQATNTHLALVVDEYGGTAGLVTIEDILEELVGELTDEHDADSAAPEEISPGVWNVPTSYAVDDLEELFDVKIDEDDVYSAGGLLTKATGKVPLPGARAEVAGLILEAGEATGRRRRVLSLTVSKAE